jgi:hypothetical protein
MKTGMAYKSSKWFQLMLDDAAVALWSIRPEKHQRHDCPFCQAARITGWGYPQLMQHGYTPPRMNKYCFWCPFYQDRINEGYSEVGCVEEGHRINEMIHDGEELPELTVNFA